MLVGFGMILLLCAVYYMCSVWRCRTGLRKARVRLLKSCKRRPVYLIFKNSRTGMGIYELSNYLFRTDIEQKWTTMEIDRNFCIWADRESGIQCFPKDYGDRKSMRVHFLNQVNKAAPAELFSAGKVKDRVSSLDLWLMDEELRSVGWIDGKTGKKIIFPVLQRLRESEKIIPLCAVVHQDEGGSHIHFLYFWKDCVGDDAEVLKLVDKKNSK